jgi:hypothetical protein
VEEGLEAEEIDSAGGYQRHCNHSVVIAGLDPAIKLFREKEMA